MELHQKNAEYTHTGKRLRALQKFTQEEGAAGMRNLCVTPPDQNQVFQEINLQQESSPSRLSFTSVAWPTVVAAINQDTRAGKPMDTNTAKTTELASPPLFIPFVFSIAGWAMLEAWLLQVGARFGAHGAATLCGAWLGYLCLRRPRIGRVAHPASVSTAAIEHRRFGSADAGWMAILLVLGGLMGALASLSSAVVLGAAAIALSLFPWSRVQLCRHYFFGACAAAWTGMLSVMALRHGYIAATFLPLACWVLWTTACISLLMRIERLARAERVAKAKPRAPRPVTSADTSA